MHPAVRFSKNSIIPERSRNNKGDGSRHPLYLSNAVDFNRLTRWHPIPFPGNQIPGFVVISWKYSQMNTIDMVSSSQYLSRASFNAAGIALLAN